MIGWDTRFAWSGETPLTWPDLNVVALQRFSENDGGDFPDAVDPSRVWTVEEWATSTDRYFHGRWGRHLGLNRLDPGGADRRALRLPFFEGLWPSSGRLLMGLWVQQNYTMRWNPLMSTRGRGDSPLAYLSTYADGDVRQGVYSASGSLLHDSYVTFPWAQTLGWQWIGQLVDLDARTSRLVVVERDTGRRFIGPASSFTGTPNRASVADLEVFALPSGSMWTGGYTDEVMVAHPGPNFDVEAFADALARGTWARGQEGDAEEALAVTDEGVTALSAITLRTGAERVSWTLAPDPALRAAVPHWSSDEGVTWQTGSLPARLDGLLRWDVPLAVGASFDGLELRPPAPALAPIDPQAALQRSTLRVPLEVTLSGAPVWDVAAPGVSAAVEGSTLVIETGWASGDVAVTVRVRDSYNRSASRSFVLTVSPEPWEAPPPPQYPRAPIVLWDDDDPAEAVIDARACVVTKEVNGETFVEFALPLKHPRAGVVRSERLVEVAGGRYRTRRITTERSGGTPVLAVYAEAAHYDLAYAGQVPEREYLQTPAGAAIEDALRDTDWSIGAVTVTTRRTYSVEETTPLAMLRLIQEQHGGDLVFDDEARTVSLVAQSGQDNGVGFFYGRNLSNSKRVVDTTSLVTRIIAQNADGVTIASVNGGLPYVEDFTYTSEVRTAVYDFASGTSPFTMLAMAQATLANRSKPSYSYEFTVADLSHAGHAIDAFDVGDIVTVIDEELDIREAQRILRIEYDVIRPWNSKVVLSGKLRELGSASGSEAGALTTGAGSTSFDLVPFNTLRNGRFDNGLAHWASSGVSVVETERGTGHQAARFAGSGLRWIEQTVSPDNRDVYSLSLNVETTQPGTVPALQALVTVEYEDGTRDTIPVDLV
ncbi:hypothetical protein A9Z40_03160 [Microbacterium arborescens]|uniref:Tip attachment protein J domain-containing protein n=1 Tax=Microbacterium arborescens TaxID=33883 RepID=A0ABX2WIT9_9MICO|nr:phage tail protein [Microbacterium arborescens]OAZ40954.1 hypothetical protein A9Z40_03160 [Microbacterium arborescens]